MNVVIMGLWTNVQMLIQLYWINEELIKWREAIGSS